MGIGAAEMVHELGDVRDQPIEGQLGTDRVFAADLQALRPHPGQGAAAANLRAVLADSAIVASHQMAKLAACPWRSRLMAA